MSINSMRNSNPTKERINWTVNEFCEAHAIGRTSFYEEVKAGKLNVVKFGKRTLVTANEAKAWQERLEAGVAH